MKRSVYRFAALMLVFLLCFPNVPALPSEGPAHPRAAPDLLVAPESYATNPDPPRLGDSITLNVTVANQGDAAAGSFSVAFYLNDTTRLLSRVTVNSLAAGASANVSCVWNTQTSETNQYFSGVNYKIIVIVDSNSAVSESDENNNRFEREQALGPERLPDLKLTGISVSTQSPVKGEIVTISATFTNTGESTGKFYKVWCFADNIQTPVASLDGPVVNISEIKSVTLFWDTASFAPGAHVLLVYVNPEFYFTRIAETNYADNNGSKQMVIMPPAEKLQVLTLDLLPSEVHQGETLTVQWAIFNNGTFGETGVPVRVLVDLRYLPEFTNQSVDVDVQETVPMEVDFDTTAYQSGDHSVRVTAGNASLSRTFTLLQMRRPDLVPQNLSFTPARPKAGQVVAVDLEVANTGDQPSGACDVSLFVDYSLTPEARQGISSLGPGELASVRLSWDSAGFTGGPHRLRIMADSGYTVVERNETNNNNVRTLELQGELDLALDNLTIHPDSPRVGDIVQFSFKVRNIGTNPADGANLSLSVKGSEAARAGTGFIDTGRFVQSSLLWSTAGLLAQNCSYEIRVAPTGDTPDVAPGNNLLEGAFDLLPPLPGPDLRVGNVTLPATPPRAGDNLTLVVRVENAGTLDCGASKLMVYLESGTSLLKFTTVAVGVPLLAAGSSVAVNATGSTESFKAGTYNLLVTVDYANEITELNESNNNFRLELQLLPPLPRKPVLRMDEVRVEGRLEKGSELNILAVVANPGDGDAIAVKVTFIIDGRDAGNRTIDTIPAGTNRTASFFWTAGAGKHTVSAKAETEETAAVTGPQLQLTVKGPPAKADEFPQTMVLVLVVVIVAASAGAAAFLAVRRKKPGREAPAPASAGEALPPEDWQKYLDGK